MQDRETLNVSTVEKLRFVLTACQCFVLPMSLSSKISYEGAGCFMCDFNFVSAFHKFPTQKKTRCFETVPSWTQELQRRNNFLLRRRQQALGYLGSRTVPDFLLMLTLKFRSKEEDDQRKEVEATLTSAKCLDDVGWISSDSRLSLTL